MATTAQEIAQKIVEAWQGFNIDLWQSEIDLVSGSSPRS
jgi:hypothetical protein